MVPVGDFLDGWEAVFFLGLEKLLYTKNGVL